MMAERGIEVDHATIASMDGSPVASRIGSDRCWSAANIYPAAPILGRPNGESARARLHSWSASKTAMNVRLVARRSDLCLSFTSHARNAADVLRRQRGTVRPFAARPR
jgi:hypothetical protein